MIRWFNARKSDPLNQYGFTGINQEEGGSFDSLQPMCYENDSVRCAVYAARSGDNLRLPLGAADIGDEDGRSLLQTGVGSTREQHKGARHLWQLRVQAGLNAAYAEVQRGDVCSIW